MEGMKGYHEPRAVGRRTRRPQDSRKQRVWVPAIASWEKEFCREIGLFTWENFLEAKRETISWEGKIVDWDDSAAKDAFDNAKNRFFAKKFNIDLPNLGTKYPIAGLDSYIDEIKWDDDEGDELKEFTRDESDGEDEEDDDDHHVTSDTKMIKPTGWGDDNGGGEVYFSSGKALVGLIIGC